VEEVEKIRSQTVIALQTCGNYIFSRAATDVGITVFLMQEIMKLGGVRACEEIEKKE
jgi:hypothetical protein